MVHLPYSDWNDTQAQFKPHVNVISGIHSESMKNNSSFLNEIAGKLVPVNVQLVQASEQTKKTNIILLSITDVLKTAGQMGIPLRGHRDDSQYHAKLESPLPILGLVILFNVLSLQYIKAKKIWKIIQKIAAVGKPISSNQLIIMF